MKTRLILAGLCLLAATTLHATPDQVVAIEERFAGSNDTTYAILRTEIDNLGSHYKSQRKVFLDERSKDGKTTVKSTLLLDEKRSIDAGHDDPKTPPPVTITVISRDDSISMAAVQDKFPQQATEPWDAAKLARLEAIPEAGVVFDRNRVYLAQTASILKETFGGRAAEDEWKLEEVSEDKNVVYLKLAKDSGDGDPETRVVCAGLEITKQVRAQAARRELYLLAGIYGKKEEAIAQAKKWTEQGINTLEVWSYPAQSDYAVVDSAGMEKMRTRGGLKGLSDSLKVEVEPVFGDQLGEWVEIP